jgi:hypothetical protein
MKWCKVDHATRIVVSRNHRKEGVVPVDKGSKTIVGMDNAGGANGPFIYEACGMVL